MVVDVTCWFNMTCYVGGKTRTVNCGKMVVRTIRGNSGRNNILGKQDSKVHCGKVGVEIIRYGRKSEITMESASSESNNGQALKN